MDDVFWILVSLWMMAIPVQIVIAERAIKRAFRVSSEEIKRRSRTSELEIVLKCDSSNLVSALEDASARISKLANKVEDLNIVWEEHGKHTWAISEDRIL